MTPTGGSLMVVGEGDGEREALPNLLTRLCDDIGARPAPFNGVIWSHKECITNEADALHAMRIAAKSRPTALLLTSDCDDDCPRELGPKLAGAVRAEQPSFPVAVVLFYREFETLMLSVADCLAGRQVSLKSGKPLPLQPDAKRPDHCERIRDAKGWVQFNLLGSSYTSTTHQVLITRAMEIADLRKAGLSSFRRLDSAIAFLAAQARAGHKGVYPMPGP